MFSKDFFPTPLHVIEMMLEDLSLEGKTILEPSAGKGDIVDFCAGAGATMLACENHPELQKIVASKCQLIASDFLTVKSDDISHVDMIVMNHPFSQDERHILHAYEIAPPGCQIVALCNANTMQKSSFRIRRELLTLVETYGSWQNIGDVFSSAQRTTDVEIALIRLSKPGEASSSEFEGFFMEEEPESQGNGIMPYNFVRDVVNRYVAAVRLYDQQLDLAVQMNTLTDSFFKSKIAASCTMNEKPVRRSEYKKDLQKSAWNFLFNKMDMDKFTTRGLKKDINKFVEQQEHVSFTMRNIYRMFDIIAGTHGQRMDRALLEVFDRITSHYHDNRYNVEGWKTNSHYLVNEKFILPYLAEVKYSGGLGIQHYNSRYEVIDDLHKALCYITGKRYEEIGSIWAFFHKPKPRNEWKNDWQTEYVVYEFNTWYDFGFFYLKGFKKGSMHFKFKDKEVWALFNFHISRIKGYPLFEHI